MIVPIIFCLNPAIDYKIYTWAFIKGLYYAKQNKTPIIVQKRLLDNFSEESEYFNQDKLDKFDYGRISKKDIERIDIHILSEKIEEKYVGSFPSKTDAYLASVTKDWPDMEEELENHVRQIEQQYKEKIEAFMVVPNNMFVEMIGKKMNIPIIHTEFCPFRAPMYRNCAYFSFENIAYSLEKEYASFMDAKLYEKVRIFSRREILALFLADDKLEYAVMDRVPAYELGVAIGYSSIHECNSVNMISPLELQTEVHEKYEPDSVYWRSHPEDPQGFRFKEKNISEGEPFADFILKCKRVYDIGINEMFEVMLYDRIAHSFGESPYSFQGNKGYSEEENRKPDIEFLNFVAFCYFVPFEMLNNNDYLRFRLSNPSYDEIYNFHLNYYLNVYGIKREALAEENVLDIILTAREYKKDEQINSKYCDGEIWFEIGDNSGFKNDIETARIKTQLKKFRDKNNYLSFRNDELEKYNNDLIDAKKWLEEENERKSTYIEELQKGNEWLRQEKSNHCTYIEELKKEIESLSQVNESLSVDKENLFNEIKHIKEDDVKKFNSDTESLRNELKKTQYMLNKIKEEPAIMKIIEKKKLLY